MIDDNLTDEERGIEIEKCLDLLDAMRDHNIPKSKRLMRSLHDIDMYIMPEDATCFGTNYERYTTPLLFAWEVDIYELAEYAIELGGNPNKEEITFQLFPPPMTMN